MARAHLEEQVRGVNSGCGQSSVRRASGSGQQVGVVRVSIGAKTFSLVETSIITIKFSTKYLHGAN